MFETLVMILVAVGAIVAGVLIYASTLPKTFEYSRSKLIKAPPEKLFGLINDLKAMNSWNPFVLRAPDQNGSYRGPESGPGAIYDFAGKKSGTGRVEIVGGEPARAVQMRLVMTRPMACDNRIDFTLTPSAEGTNVTWRMSGEAPLLNRAMCAFMNPDKMVGGAFEEGLNSLKAKAEAK